VTRRPLPLPFDIAVFHPVPLQSEQTSTWALITFYESLVTDYQLRDACARFVRETDKGVRPYTTVIRLCAFEGLRASRNVRLSVYIL
jgi:hypothetical protein